MITVINNEQNQQFLAPVEDETAYMEYRLKDGIIYLMHTDVPDRLSGRGIGTALATYAFNYARENGLKVKVYCPFVLTYLKRHPELANIVA